MRLAHWIILLTILLCWSQLTAMAQEIELGDTNAVAEELDLDALDTDELEDDAGGGDATEIQALGDEDELELGEADVYGKRSIRAQLGDSHALTVIDEAAFAGAVTVGEVLERVPGVDIRLSGGMGQLTSVHVRGARAEQVLVLVDGAPLAAEVADFSLLPIGALERVEVVRGAEAARFGAGALGGVVNLVTRHAEQAKGSCEDEPTVLPLCEHKAELWPVDNRDAQRHGEATIVLGGHDALSAALSISEPGASYYLQHLQVRNDFSYQRTGGGRGTRQNNDVSQQSFWVRWDVGGIAHRAGVTHSRRGVPGSVEFPTLEARLGQDGVWWQTLGESWRADFSVLNTQFTDPDPVLSRGAIDTENTLVHGEWSAGALAGLPVSWGIKPRVDYISGDDTGRHWRGGVDTYRYWQHESGAWLLDFELGLGASSDIGVDPLVRLGVSTELAPGVSAYAAAGYAVRHPSFRELYYADIGSVRGNEELDSERVLSYELGLTATGQNARCELAAFFSDYRDSIIWAPISAYTVQAINTGPAEVAGVEALIDWQLGDGLWWRTAGTWLGRAEYDSGVPLTGRSDYHLNSRLECTRGEWSGALAVDCTGEIPADLFGNLVIEPRALVGVELARETGVGEIGVAVNNLFDEDARDNWNYPLPGREIYVTWRTEL